MIFKEDKLLKDKLDRILHLNGCQQRTAGHNEAKSGLDIDMDAMEDLEKKTLNEVMDAVLQYINSIRQEHSEQLEDLRYSQGDE